MKNIKEKYIYINGTLKGEGPWPAPPSRDRGGTRGKLNGAGLLPSLDPRVTVLISDATKEIRPLTPPFLYYHSICFLKILFLIKRSYIQ